MCLSRSACETWSLCSANLPRAGFVLALLSSRRLPPATRCTARPSRLTSPPTKYCIAGFVSQSKKLTFVLVQHRTCRLYYCPLSLHVTDIDAIVEYSSQENFSAMSRSVIFPSALTTTRLITSETNHKGVCSSAFRQAAKSCDQSVCDCFGVLESQSLVRT